MVAAHTKVLAHGLFFTSYVPFPTPTREVMVVGEAPWKTKDGLGRV